MQTTKFAKKSSVIVILGPTSSGKTHLAVSLAYDFSGEIVSADSRQVYQGMDIGTGKDLFEYQRNSKNIPYHLIDVASPKRTFNLRRYQIKAQKAISNIIQRNKLPIVVGGSGLYLQALIDNYDLPIERKDKKNRMKLESLGAEKLLILITNIQADFAKRLNNSDSHNARRLARYLEILQQKGGIENKKKPSLYNFLILGLDISDDKLRQKIKERLRFRLDKQGLIEEVKNLKTTGLTYKKLINFGLEYKYVSYFLQGKMTKDEMQEKLEIAIYRFAKKQKTWFRRFEKQGANIVWIKNEKQARSQILRFLKTPA